MLWTLVVSGTGRTLVCDVLAEATAGRMVDFPSSSSEEKGSSRAVLNDSVRESPGVGLDVTRSPSGSCRALGRCAGCGGVTSGVGGLRWSGGVTGARWTAVLGVVCDALSVVGGLGWRPEWLPEEVRDCVGGVGGRSGPVPILFGWCLRVRGLEGSEPELAGWEVSTTRSYFLGRRRGLSWTRSGCGRGKTLCLLNCRGAA